MIDTVESWRPGTRGILTFAFGQQKYVEMAKALARSVRLNAPGEPMAVVTDSKDAELGTLFDVVIPYRAEFGGNVRQKIYIDRYSPWEETLFIDGDSLVMGGLEGFWETFGGRPFGVPGHTELRRGDWDEYMEVDYVLERLELERLPKFNGGTYWFNRSAEAGAFFATAREVLERCAELRLREFRGDGPCDEAVYSVAMGLHGLTATDMGAGGMWTPIAATTAVEVDVARGLCRFTKRDRRVQPEVMHFATWTERYVYLRECRRVERIAAAGYRREVGLTVWDFVQLRVKVASLRVRRAFFGARRRWQAAVRAWERPVVRQPRASFSLD